MGTDIEMKESIIRSLETSLLKLRAIWTEVGMTEEQKEERNQVVITHMVSLLEQMVDEETEMKNKILANIKEFSRELTKVCDELQVPQMKVDESLTLLEIEKNLRTEVDRLSLERHLRLKKLKKLVDDEDRICKRLSKSLNPDRIVGVPTENRLNEYGQYVETMQKELTKREEMFSSTKEVLLHLWDELEVTQTDDQENIIASSDSSNYLLSDSNMDYLKSLITNYETQLKKNEEQAKQLRHDIEHLWDRLDIEEEQRQAFNEVTRGCKPSVLTALEIELETLNKMKLENLKKLVEKTRQDLTQWWDKCYFGSEERMKFVPITSEDFSEDLLNLHEQEIAKVAEYYEQYQSYYQRVEHWYNLWNKWLEFEAKANDPNRFGNRGGKLLQEEKLRRALNKEFPKVEKDLKAQLLNYEKANGKPFLINDQRFLDTIDALKEEHKLRKVQEKMDRQLAKERELHKEMSYGSKVTPSKRRFGATGNVTPIKTPTAKKPKVSAKSTGGALSKVQSRINMPRSSKTPGGVRAAKSNRVTSAKSTRSKNIRILKEMNDNISEGYNFEKANMKMNEISFSSSKTSFADFTKELHEATKNNQRSSVLSTVNDENAIQINY